MFAVCTATCINCWTDTSPNWCRTKADGKEQKGYYTVLSGIFCALRQDLFVSHQCALLRVQQVRLFCCFASGLPGPLGMHHSRSTVLAVPLEVVSGVCQVCLCVCHSSRAAKAFMHATFPEAPAAKKLFCSFASGLPGHLGIHHSCFRVLAASKAFDVLGGVCQLCRCICYGSNAWKAFCMLLTQSPCCFSLLLLLLIQAIKACTALLV